MQPQWRHLTFSTPGIKSLVMVPFESNSLYIALHRCIVSYFPVIECHQINREILITETADPENSPLNLLFNAQPTKKRSVCVRLYTITRLDAFAGKICFQMPPPILKKQVHRSYHCLNFIYKTCIVVYLLCTRRRRCLLCTRRCLLCTRRCLLCTRRRRCLLCTRRCLLCTTTVSAVHTTPTVSAVHTTPTVSAVHTTVFVMHTTVFAIYCTRRCLLCTARHHCTRQCLLCTPRCLLRTVHTTQLHRLK